MSNYICSREKEGKGRCEPVCGDNGVSLDVEFFGFGLMPDFGNGGSIFLFLKFATHVQFCVCSISVSGIGFWILRRTFNLAYVRTVCWASLGSSSTIFIRVVSRCPRLRADSLLVFLAIALRWQEVGH